ncbi:MAG: ABC transporter ATP-binding protein, partial [Lachnospiraceae bacterium]|nr:ABC transporter ATP-binding protein [Lachnospiraceae bacterium]
MKVVFEGLTKRFPNRNKKGGADVIAVNDFNFEIPSGKLISLLGPSGCGKSTALNLICGLEKPTEGKIFFDDNDVTKLPPEKRGIGMVFQNYALYPHLTVRQNIIFPLENLKGEEKLTKEQMNSKADEAARLVQIEELMDRKPSELSGGQQQRVAIARALVKTPNILLLDEPLSNLDARLALQTREEIRRIQKETGVTTIFVTHNQEDAMSISDLIIVMNSGVIQQIGKPQEVYDKPANLFVAKFLGNPPVNLFKGSIKNGSLFIGDDEIPDIHGKDRETLTVGIRPEGFIVDKNGPLKCDLKDIEVMGRDTSVVSIHPAAATDTFRVIIPSDESLSDDSFDRNRGKISFSLKKNKLYLFDENG